MQQRMRKTKECGLFINRTRTHTHTKYLNVIPGKTSIWDRSQAALIDMLTMQRIWLISNHIHDRTIHPTATNYWYGVLVYHQSHPNFGKRISPVHTMHRPISAAQFGHSDWNYTSIKSSQKGKKQIIKHLTSGKKTCAISTDWIKSKFGIPNVTKVLLESNQSFSLSPSTSVLLLRTQNICW